MTSIEAGQWLLREQLYFAGANVRIAFGLARLRFWHLIPMLLESVKFGLRPRNFCATPASLREAERAAAAIDGWEVGTNELCRSLTELTFASSDFGHRLHNWAGAGDRVMKLWDPPAELGNRWAYVAGWLSAEGWGSVTP